MATEKVHEIPIANVARVEIVTEETTARTFRVTTADKAKIEAFVSEGEEKELRKGNRLLAQLKTEDLIKGYDVTLNDLTMNPEAYAIIDGGVSTAAEDGTFQNYTGPKVGEVLKRTPFTLNVYTEEKDGDGETKGYLKLSCKHCKGTPASIELKDGDFCAPEYKLKSRPKIGEIPLSIDYLTELPA